MNEKIREEIEEMSVFKSYLRILLRQLKFMQEALASGDVKKASTLLNELIEDTFKGISD